MKVMGGLEVRRLLKKISGEWGYFKANRQVAITCRLFSGQSKCAYVKPPDTL